MSLPLESRVLSQLRMDRDFLLVWRSQCAKNRHLHLGPMIDGFVHSLEATIAEATEAWSEKNRVYSADDYVEAKRKHDALWEEKR